MLNIHKQQLEQSLALALREHNFYTEGKVESSGTIHTAHTDASLPEREDGFKIGETTIDMTVTHTSQIITLPSVWSRHKSCEEGRTILLLTPRCEESLLGHVLRHLRYKCKKSVHVQPLPDITTNGSVAPLMGFLLEVVDLTNELEFDNIDITDTSHLTIPPSESKVFIHDTIRSYLTWWQNLDEHKSYSEMTVFFTKRLSRITVDSNLKRKRARLRVKEGVRKYIVKDNDWRYDDFEELKNSESNLYLKGVAPVDTSVTRSYIYKI